ncbi:TlpA family protein disulfide reductase [Halorubrum cibi]|uniref:Thiol-disulfide isomerase or thioredoxin n=1 Tax=Halorubrum cibi TaxID=413815 RepID=A0A521AVI7_9EURY|nr:TlpA disulfide reductase family protein [Halorubrum cibi]SMO38804.1 Thiol-disulfide isomerase or thioredoxin [Halorubrum cibi]
MERRHLLAGIASVGALGGAGAVAMGAVPEALGGSSAEAVELTTIPTIDAPGSREGEVTIPAEDQVTFVDFFGTWCPPCAEQMPALAEAHDRIGDEALFVSVTTEDVGGAVSEETVVDWWREHDGDWLVGADVTAELSSRVTVQGFPTAVVIDADRRIAWKDSEVHTADRIVEEIENVLD